MAAYDAPSVAIVSAKVASATDGAAPKSPAKLFGFNTSPMIAKTDTTAPPTRKRIRIWLTALDPSSHACFNQFSGLLWPFQSQHSVVLAGKLVIIYKELFQFTAELLSQITNSLDVGPTMGVFLNCNDSIIAFLLFLIALLTLNDSDYTADESATGKCRLVHQYQHVHGIAIVGFG